MKYLEKIEKLVNPLYAREYKGGLELRGVDIERAKEQIQKSVDHNGWPVEIFETDIRLKSISIRIKSK